MLKARIYKLKPTKDQCIHLDNIFSNCIFIYNWSLDLKIRTYRQEGKNLSAFDIMKCLTKLKKENPILLNTPIHSLQHSITNMESSFKNFYKGGGFPKWKNINSKKTFHIPQGISIDKTNKKIFIPKIKRVKFFDDGILPGQVRNGTIFKKLDNYYISILYDDGLQKQHTGGVGEVGIDLGLKHFLITSEGDKVEVNKPFCNSQKQLRVLQRKLSRQEKGSKRREFTRQQIAKLQEKISNQRQDFLHKTSTSIAKKYDTVYIENLNVAGMMKNRCLAKHIADVGRGMFATMLKYKCNNVVEIGRFEPSSKLCSNCGHIYGELKLSEREWTCKSCDARHDRDINAAVNIKNLGAGAQLADAKTKQ